MDLDIHTKLMIKDVSENPTEATFMTEEEIEQARTEVSNNMVPVPGFMNITMVCSTTIRLVRLSQTYKTEMTGNSKGKSANSLHIQLGGR